MKKLFVAAAAAAVLAACQSTPQEPVRATAALQPTKGSKAFGEATFEEVEGGKVRVIVFAQGLKPNAEHGFHIHEAGDCSSGDGMSTKGHFNPHGKPHGQPTSGERHAGDLPAFKSDKGGRAKVDVTLDIITVRPGPASVVGRGLIIHADPDDYKTQPTGNAGARIACGVIKAG
jgi:superoxide dismutase, Cu-Zn family